MAIEVISEKVQKLKRRYQEDDPERLCQCMGIRILRIPMGKGAKDCKGFFIIKSRIPLIVLNDDLPLSIRRIVLAHELGHAVWQAKQCCPQLVVLPPNYPLYVRFSRYLREIYMSYTDQVESYGLDECWLDVSGKHMEFEDGKRIADEIRHRVWEELGITVSVGVADNKVFAKLGSDYKKPNATTVFSRDNYRELVWPLPVSDLLFVGRSTTRKLADMGIHTIGDLACADPGLIRYKLNKPGTMLQAFALGLDTSPVKRYDEADPIKSIGNSSTPPKDIQTLDDVRSMIYLLSESVGVRMRENGMRAQTISIGVRTTDLRWFSCQRKIARPTCLTRDIATTAMDLVSERYAWCLPFRSIGVDCSTLIPDSAPEQLDMYEDYLKREKAEQLEKAIDQLRRRFGYQVIRRGVVMRDRQFATVNPRDEHEIHPIAFMTNRSDLLHTRR